jgi:hypothetical protein
MEVKHSWSGRIHGGVVGIAQYMQITVADPGVSEVITTTSPCLCFHQHRPFSSSTMVNLSVGW